MNHPWDCPACGAHQRAKAKACDQCGARRQASPRAAAAPTTGLCPIDGAPLHANGTCSKTGGYPYGAPCPFVCPACRQALAWDGRCQACRNYPGDRWDAFFDDLTPISDGHHRHKLGDPSAVVHAGDVLRSSPQTQPEPTVAVQYACALAFEAYQRGLITKQAALATYEQVFKNPEQAEDVVAFYRARLGGRSSSRPDGPERAGDILRRGPVIDPDIRARLARQEASP